MERRRQLRGLSREWGWLPPQLPAPRACGGPGTPSRGRCARGLSCLGAQVRAAWFRPHGITVAPLSRSEEAGFVTHKNGIGLEQVACVVAAAVFQVVPVDA